MQYWSDSVETASIANHQITSEWSGEHWKISGTNLNSAWSWKECTLLRNSTIKIIKLNISSIQYTLRYQWLLSLSRYSPEFYGNYRLFYSSWKCHSMVSRSMNSQNPSWYSSLKSISILSSHIHTDLLNRLFPTCFPIKNLFKITFIPMHSTFLTHLPLFSNTPVSDKQYKLWNSTLSIIFLQFPLYLFQTLFLSLWPQTKPAYKRQKTLPILKSPSLCYSHHTSIF